jgi:hypothetical protein
MNKKLEAIIKRGRVIALAGLASLAIGCASVEPNIETPQNVKPKAEVSVPVTEKAIPIIPMSPVYLAGKTLNERFKEVNGLSSEQQVNLAKNLNNLSVWETVLLSRYAPIDGILRKLSSFYSTDYKKYLQAILSGSILDPMAVGLTGDKGFGQITPSSEKWARDLYSDKTLGYKFPGAEITNNTLDPYTNLVLSSILFRKAAEEKIADLDAVYALYNQGFRGVSPDKDGLYATNNLASDVVNRAKTFDSIADDLMVFSWVSMNRPDLSKYIEDKDLRKVAENNNDTYDGKVAYEGMIGFLNSISTNKDKYSNENRKMFKDETANVSSWLKNLYGNGK